MDAAARLASVFRQPIEIETIVFVSKEASLAVVPRWIRCWGTFGKVIRARRGMGRPRGTKLVKANRKLWSVLFYSYIRFFFHAA
jgi:hypothetical protein